MNAVLSFAFWLQATPDVRSVSWWLPTGPLRELLWWTVLVLNLLVLVYVLYRMMFAGKDWSVPRMLRSRKETIRQQLRDAEAAQREAEARLAEIEARVAGLPAELQRLKAEGEAEAEAEYHRLVESSRQEAARLIAVGRGEIEAAAKVAGKELRGLAARLALDLAGRRIREQWTPELDQDVVARAVEGMNLKRPN